jgi:hypothetical protein
MLAGEWHTLDKRAGDLPTVQKATEMLGEEVYDGEQIGVGIESQELLGDALRPTIGRQPFMYDSYSHKSSVVTDLADQDGA